MDLRSKSLDQLFQAVLNLETLEDCYRFFEDVCTIKELQDLSQRFQIAVLLDRGMNYQAIAKEVDTSSTTISRVNNCLNYGSGGYRDAVGRLKAAKDAKNPDL